MDEEPDPTDPPPPGETVEIHPPHAPIQSLKDFLIALGTITAGVLIALSIEGLLEWNHYRVLVREARETISREIAQNKNEVDGVLARVAVSHRELENALTFADELLRDRKSNINQIRLGFEIADLSAASWETAERTGALAHMDYAEVRQYSMLYGYQQLFTNRQRQAVDRVAAASGFVYTNRNPHEAQPKDLEIFRQHVLELRAELTIQEKLGRQLSDHYEKALAK